MLTHPEQAAAGEPWPRTDVDPEFDEEMRRLGARVPTRSLDRPRIVVQPRPAWLAFLLTVVSRLAAIGRSVVMGAPRGACPEIDGHDLRIPERDPSVATHLAAAGVHLATRSLDRPRRVVPSRPAWLAFLRRLLHVQS